MSSADRLGLVVAAGSLAFFCAAFSAPAGAEDLKPPVDEMTAQVNELEALAKKHTSEKADDALKTDVASAVKLYGQLADTKLKARLIVLIGTVLQANKTDMVQKAAIKAFGDLAEPTGARFVRPFLAQRTPDENPPLLLDAVDAASKMKSDDSVAALLTLIQKSKVMPVAVAAMQAFATYGKNKSTRERILSEIIETVKKDRPGVGWRWSAGGGGLTGPQRERTAPTRSGEDTVNRYQALAGVMNETLNKMTGQNNAEPETWFDLKDNYKSNLGMLFPKD